ncbi:polyprenol phosphomannose-dependent alpha 1,6 mannosyltransferase MptB [Nesterenkonia suensis]
MRDTVISRAAWRVREVLGSFPGTAWLIGGEEAAASHTLRQGLLASLMIMVGSWGVGWLAMTPSSVLAVHPMLLPLRTTTAGVIVCAVLLSVGALLLLRSWLRLSQRVGGWHAEATVTIRRAVLMWGAPLLFTVPIFSRDVYSYLAQGRVLHAGLNPYESGVSELPGWFMEGADGLWAESPSPYGPLFLLLARLIWFVSDGVPEISVALFRLLSVLGVALMLVALPRLARAFGSEPAWALWLCVLNPLSLLVFLPAAHNDALMIGLMLLGMCCALDRRRICAVLLLTAAVAIKPIAITVLPFALLLSLQDPAALVGRYAARLREWLIGGALAAGLLVAGGLLLGVGLGWITAALSAGSAIAPVAPVGLLGTGLGLVAAVVWGLDAQLVASWIFAGARVLSAGVLAWMLLRRRLGNPLLWAGLGLLVVILSSTVIQPWYLLWVLPLFAVAHVHRGRSLVLVSVLLSVLVLLSLVGQLSVAQWIDTTVVQLIAAGVAVVYLVYLLLFDPNTMELFDMRRPSQAWNAGTGWMGLGELLRSTAAAAPCPASHEGDR